MMIEYYVRFHSTFSYDSSPSPSPCLSVEDDNPNLSSVCQWPARVEESWVRICKISLVLAEHGTRPRQENRHWHPGYGMLNRDEGENAREVLLSNIKIVTT